MVAEIILQANPMSETKKSILVTWDFTEISEYAFSYALEIAKTVGNDIKLINVVKPQKSELLKAAKDRLQKESIRLSEKHSFEVGILILEGELFTAISSYVNKETVNFVVMGTHGIRGFQKYFGSFALRVMVGSQVPFIVVQGKPDTTQGINNIVFPIDYKTENKEKLQWAIYLGKYFNSKILLYKMSQKDKALVKKINTNLNFAIRFLIQNNIEYEIHTATKKGNFGRQTLAFAADAKAELIIITTTKHITFLDYLFAAPEQYIIANTSQIPVMCINPKSSFIKMGQFMYGPG